MNDYERLGEVLDALAEASEFLDNYVDVVDGDYGDYGEQWPNKAMRVQNAIEDSIVVVLNMRERIGLTK